MPDRSQLFTDIDSMEPERFTAHLADDVTMRFGNADPVQGRAAVHDVWAAFCDGIDGVSHAPRRRWESDEGTVAEGDVTYTRKDGGTVTVPVVTIYRSSGELIDDYRVYIDLAPLFARPRIREASEGHPTVMPDAEGNEKYGETSTPLHAYEDGREEDVEGAEETQEGNPEAASDREPGEHTF